MHRPLIAALGGAIISLSLAGCGSGKPEKSSVPDNPVPPPDKGARQSFGGPGQGQGHQPIVPGAKKGVLDPNVK
jgi:hypothetical protein